MLKGIFKRSRNKLEDTPFRNIFEGKQQKIEDAINTTNELLSKLETDEVITEHHREAIEVRSFVVDKYLSWIFFSV